MLIKPLHIGTIRGQQQLDDAASRMKRANSLLEWSKEQNQKYDFSEKLEAFQADMQKKHGRPDAITHKGAADDGGVGPAYIIYRELSGASVRYIAQQARHLGRRGRWCPVHGARASDR
jgi:hypothetical protein